MPSPFPGMNPYLEHPKGWANFHHQFIAELARALNRQMVPGLFAAVEEHIFITGKDDSWTGRADTAIVEFEPVSDDGAAVAVLEAPVVAQFPEAETIRQPFVAIRADDGDDVLTVVELLSPSNKRRGSDGEQYLAKRREVLSSEANFVEIDLLRGGVHPPLDGRTPCDYSVTVCDKSNWPNAGFWPIAIRDRLPNVPIPVRQGIQLPNLDLQAVMNAVYDDGRFEPRIYRRPIKPRLSPADAAWAARFVPGRPA